MNDQPVQHVGFWARVLASLVDTILMLIICVPLVMWTYGSEYWTRIEGRLFAGPADFVINWLLPAVAVVLFWIYRQATPGKMAIGAKIVDAKTLSKPSTGQLVGRYLGYYVSILPFLFGLFWVGIDKKKQGFHDKLAGTLVIRSR